MAQVDWGQEVTAREKILAIVILLAIVYVFGSLVWGTQRAKTKRLRKQHDVITIQLEALEQVIDAQEPITAAPPSAPVAADPRFADYLAGKPQSRDYVMGETVRALSSPTVLGGLELIHFTYGKIEDFGLNQRVPFSLKFMGSFGATTRYLEHIESEPLLVIFEEVQISSMEEARSQLELTIDGQLYIVSQK